MALTDGLELLIPYENSNVEDQSGNGRNGTIVGMTFETATPLIGLVSGNYVAPGDYLTFGQVIGFSVNQSFTLAKWFKVSDRTQFQPLVARQASANQAGYMLAIGGFSGVGEIAGWMGTNLSNRLIKRSSTLVTNATKMLAMFEYDGSATIGGLTLRLNNVDAGNGGTVDLGTVTDPNYSGIDLRMGARDSDAGTFSLDGLGDVGAIWSRVLTADERAEFYNNGNGWEGAVVGRRRRIETMRLMQ